MNRRGFLAMFAGAVLDPERLLWVPGKKLISIPAASQRLPFVVAATFQGGRESAEVIQTLLNHRWTTDLSWRWHAEDLLGRRLQRLLLGDNRQNLRYPASYQVFR
jgi:hypothetical protein